MKKFVIAMWAQMNPIIFLNFINETFIKWYWFDCFVYEI